MHDSRDAIIYIGKAVSLRKRVHQYFQPSHDEGIKKAQMVKPVSYTHLEMDGFDTSKGILILAATNRPEVLDKALLRPGRFDRRIIVDKPDLKGRLETLKVHSKDVMMDETVDLDALALATAGLVLSLIHICVYDVRELLDSSVKLMDGKSPLEIELPGPLNVLKKPLLRVVKGTVVEKLLRDHDVIKDGML